MTPEQQRFWTRVDQGGGPSACWLWMGMRTNDYGQFYLKGTVRRAHRLAYEWLVGPIPEGLTIDHLCRNRACVNPAHLEPVTQRENTLRGTGLTAINARKTHCWRGHEFTEANTYRSRKGRECVTCRGLTEHRALRPA